MGDLHGSGWYANAQRTARRDAPQQPERVLPRPAADGTHRWGTALVVLGWLTLVGGPLAMLLLRPWWEGAVSWSPAVTEVVWFGATVLPAATGVLLVATGRGIRAIAWLVQQQPAAPAADEVV